MREAGVERRALREQFNQQAAELEQVIADFSSLDDLLG